MLAMPRLPAVIATLCPGRIVRSSRSLASSLCTVAAMSVTRSASNDWRTRKMAGSSDMDASSPGWSRIRGAIASKRSLARRGRQKGRCLHPSGRGGQPLILAAQSLDVNFRDFKARDGRF